MSRKESDDYSVLQTQSRPGCSCRGHDVEMRRKNGSQRVRKKSKSHGSGRVKRFSNSHGSGRVTLTRPNPTRPDPRGLTRPVNSPGCKDLYDTAARWSHGDTRTAGRFSC